jgi:hypothetical protein
VSSAATTTWRERKQLLRAIVTEVVLTVRVEDRQADVRIVWEGGAATEFVLTLNKTGGHFRATDEDTVTLMRRLAEHYADTMIATILSQQRRTTGTGLSFTRSRVCSLRHARPALSGRTRRSWTVRENQIKGTRSVHHPPMIRSRYVRYIELRSQ